MNRKHLRLALFALATICFIATVATTDHVISVAALGVLLGYSAGRHLQEDPDAR